MTAQKTTAITYVTLAISERDDGGLRIRGMDDYADIYISPDLTRMPFYATLVP